MSGVPIAGADARLHLDPLLVFDGLKGAQRREGIGLGVDRQDRGATPRRIPPIERLDLAFLDAAGVWQHVGAEINRAARRMDTAGEALLHELRQEPAVIDMRMGQQDSVDTRGLEREGAIVQRLQRLGALKQPAVDENSRTRRLEQIAGAGHGASRTAEAQGDAHDDFSLLRAAMSSGLKASASS